jgi:hypothetical protein
MHKLYELKEMLCEELEQYGDRDKLDVGGLEIVDKLAHAIKNLDKIIEAKDEEEYSMDGMGGGSYRGGSYEYRRRYPREGGGSYARGRGRNARRDSMGRYSREGGYSRAAEDMVEQLREMMEEAPDEQTKKEIQKLVTKIEQM